MDINRIKNIYCDPRLFLGGGVDSSVLVIPPIPQDTKKYAAKFYKNHLPLSQVEFYTRIMNKASEMAASEKWSWHFGRTLGKLAVRVVPVEEILISDNNLPVAIVPRITAPSCEYQKYNFTPYLEKIGAFMNEFLGVDGILFSPLNARTDLKEHILYITDLCDGIMDLKVRNH